MAAKLHTNIYIKLISITAIHWRAEFILINYYVELERV